MSSNVSGTLAFSISLSCFLGRLTLSSNSGILFCVNKDKPVINILKEKKFSFVFPVGWQLCPSVRLYLGVRTCETHG